MQSFVDVLKTIQTIDPKDAFQQIFRFFEAINRMDKETVIAAYQTLEVFCNKTGQSKYSGDLESIWKALVGRMNVLCSEVPPKERNSIIGGYCSATKLDRVYFSRVIVKTDNHQDAG